MLLAEYMRRVSTCHKFQLATILEGACCITHSGAMPNIKDVNSKDITPQKNVSFSRVRTTFAVCQAAAREIRRDET